MSTKPTLGSVVKNVVMGGIAATLTKEEMAGLARYFASLPTPLNDKNRKD